MLELTIYPTAKAHPKGVEEKARESKKVHNNGVVVSIGSMEELIDYITTNAWSPGVFSGKKIKDNFKHCDFLAYDIDSGMTIQDAEKIVHNLNLVCLCVPTTSHSDDLHKFRLVFPLSQRIVGQDEFEENWKQLATHFSIDESCKDCSRFYFGSTLVDGFLFEEGELYEPIKPKHTKQSRGHLQKQTVYVGEELHEIVESIYGEARTYIPKCVEFFLANASTGLEGLWWISLNNFCFVLALQEVEEHVIISVVEKLAPNPLDDTDFRCIKIAIKDAENELLRG